MNKATLVRGALGGIVGGALMALWSMIAMWLTGPGFWTPLNLIAHAAWRSAPLDGTFSVAALVVGVLVHFAVAVCFGLVFAALMAPAAGWNTKTITTTLSGVAYGLVIWLVMHVLVWPVADPAAAAAFPLWIFAVGHVIYGLTVGLFVGPVRRTADPAAIGPEVSPR